MNHIANWLVLGRPGLGFKGLEHDADSGGVAVLLSHPLVGSEDAMGWLRWNDLIATSAMRWSSGVSGAVEQVESVAAGPVWSGVPFDDRADALRGLTPDHGAGRLIPTFLIVESGTPTQTTRSVMCLSRLRSAGLVFSLVWSDRCPATEPLIETVRRAAAADPQALHRLTDESRQTVNLSEGTEIELKCTFREPIDVVDVMTRFQGLLHRRELDGFLPDVGNETQRWTYEQDTYAIHRDGESLGYAAFGHTATGLVDVKYKLYRTDALRRAETFDDGMTVSQDGQVDFLREKFPNCQLKALPHMTRVRFDVNVQSARTGHFYGLETDEVHADGRVLNQLEIEYPLTARPRGDHGDNRLRAVPAPRPCGG